MHVGGNGIERGKLAADDVAVRGERIAKGLTIAGFGGDDDRLDSHAATLDRLPKRLVELRIGGLCVGKGGDSQG